jgi:cytoskeletal protein CcmA (bactofilin family)
MLALCAMAAAAIPVIATAAAAQTEDHDRHDALVVLTGGAHVTADQSFHDVVVFDGDVTMEGEVHETLVVFNGDADVSGTVGGDVVVFNGDVTVRSGASILGDLASTREPVIEEGAEVAGDVRRPSKDFFRPLEVFAARAAFWLAATVSFLLLGVVLLWLAPRGMDAMAKVWESSKGSSALWGVILLIGLPVGAVLVMLTLVGIPFGLGTLFALGLLYSAGYVAGAWALGRSIVHAPASRWAAFLAGFAIVRLVGLIPIIGGIVSTIVTVFGLGLVAVAVWRARKAPVTAPA